MSHIIFATRRSASAVGSMQKNSFRVRDLEQRVAQARLCKGKVDRGYIASLEAELVSARRAAKAAQTRFEKAQRDLSWG